LKKTTEKRSKESLEEGGREGKRERESSQEGEKGREVCGCKKATTSKDFNLEVIKFILINMS
jgi:hypothetical protein